MRCELAVNRLVKINGRAIEDGFPVYIVAEVGINHNGDINTLDRASWGTDQAASVEPQGFERLVRDIRVIEKALGDGVKRVYPSELPSLQKLRKKREMETQ